MPMIWINNNPNATKITEVKPEDDKQASDGEQCASEGTATQSDSNQTGAAAETVKQVGGADAYEVMRKIEQSKEEKRRQEIEEAMRKRKEEERIAQIMNANKVNVNSFIEEGKATRTSAEEEKKKEEELRRAQEIIDRLNREAAEDEAAKVAEIEAAKQEAAEKFDQ